MTHWAVESDSAKELTTRTFSHFMRHPKAPKADSLREAMLQVMEGLLLDMVRSCATGEPDPLTAAGSQSNDGKAALIQVYLAGDMGGSQANEGVEAVRDIVAGLPVQGPAANGPAAPASPRP